MCAKSKYWESSNPVYSSFGKVLVNFSIYNMGNGSIFIEGGSDCSSNKVLINADDYIKPKYYSSFPKSKFKYFISYITNDVDLSIKGIDYAYSTLSKLVYSIKNNSRFWETTAPIPLRLSLYLNCISINESNFDPYREISYKMPFQFLSPQQKDDVLFAQFMIVPKPIEFIQVNDVCDYTCTIFDSYKGITISSDQYLFKQNNITRDYVRDRYIEGWFRKLEMLNLRRVERSNITSVLSNAKFDLDSIVYNSIKSNSNTDFNSVFFANYIIHNPRNAPLAILLSITYPIRKTKPKIFMDKYEYYDIFYHDNLNTLQDYKDEYFYKCRNNDSPLPMTNDLLFKKY